MFAGFSIGGIDWLWPDLADAQDQEAKVERIAKIGFEDTRLTHSMGGNIIRIFFNLGHILSPFSAVPLDMSGLSPRFERPWYLLPEEEKLAVCDDVMAFLASAQAALRVVPPDGDGLQLWDLDAYIQGVTCYWEFTRASSAARPRIAYPRHTATCSYIGGSARRDSLGSGSPLPLRSPLGLILRDSCESCTDARPPIRRCSQTRERRVRIRNR